MKLKLPEKPNISRRTATVILLSVTSAVLLGLIIFGIFNLRRVTGISVSGNEHYTDELIIELSGIKSGDKISDIHTANVEKSITSGAPRIKSVHIDIGLFGGVSIKVVPEQPKYYMTLPTGEFFLISDEFRIIDSSMSSHEYESLGIMRISLPRIGSAVVGDYIVYKGDTEEEREKNRQRADDFLEKVYGLCGDYVTAVSFEDIYSGVYVVLGGKYKIVLGNMNDIEKKLTAALETVQAHGEEKKCAVIDAVNYGEIFYSSVDKIEY